MKTSIMLMRMMVIMIQMSSAQKKLRLKQLSNSWREPNISLVNSEVKLVLT